MDITAEKLSWVDSDGNKIEISVTEAPRKVRKSVTGPDYRMRGVARFASGPCFVKYGTHPVPVDFGISAVEALAWWKASCASVGVKL